VLADRFAPRGPAVLLAVAAGGALGGLARYAIAEGLPRAEPVAGTGLDQGLPGTVWPWATFLTNLVGCFLVGLIVEVLIARSERRRHAAVPVVFAYPFLVTGVLGGFTTFSALGVESLDLVNAGRLPLAVAYIAASLLLGLLAVTAGRAVGRESGRPGRRSAGRGRGGDA
jgi:CrcB protein